MTTLNPPEDGDAAEAATATEALRARLEALRKEHQQLDEALHKIATHPSEDELMIRRMKKRKLLVKDGIRALEQMLDPDPNEYA
ncbi:MAG TPA: YdcH family protein [Rugosibacter sp.]